jgi:ATP-dependent DNA ligase
LENANTLGVGLPCTYILEALKEFSKALQKPENGAGLFAEIKYDGERVQVHKCGSEYKVRGTDTILVLHRRL